MRKKWHIAPPMPPHFADQFPAISPLLAQILYNRGIHDPDTAQDFIEGRCRLHDPFAMRDMDRAVDVLIRAIRRKDPIVVYGDFDADGITATALLTQALTGLGADVRPYIPNRIEEGYGLNLDALRTLYGQGARVIVTVDCGIRSISEIDQARRGLEFVITDHHSIGSRLPFASAVLNPKRSDGGYPFKDLAGVGVAFKLAQALIQEAATCSIPVHIETDALLDLVAVGTVADMVPLLDENRALVQKGLTVINEGRREGLRALMRVARLRPGDISASTIGFVLGPRLNASGRLGDALLSYKLLVSAEPAAADALAQQLNAQNTHRQELMAQTYEIAEQMTLTNLPGSPLLYAAAPSFLSGIVGLVAGRLTETYYRPAVVVEQGPETSKGSCRSIPEFHITQALDQCQDLIIRHGGHAAAAGFTVSNENLEALIDRLSQLARDQLGDQELCPTLNVDAEVSLCDMDWAVWEWLRRLEPCGFDNPMPLFLSRDVPVVQARPIGSDGRHLKLVLAAGNQTRDAIAFRLADRLSELGDRVDIVYSLELNEWNGERRLQLNVRDLCAAAPNQGGAS